MNINIGNRNKEVKKEKWKENPLIEEISKELNKENMSLFVGAGFSKNANKDFPDWFQLLKEMMEELYEEKIEEWKEKNKDFKEKEYIDFLWKLGQRKGFLKIPKEYVKLKGMRESLTIYIEKKVKKINDDIENLNYETHRKLGLFKWNNIYTSNYDTTLEESLREFSYGVVKEAKDLSIGSRKRIIKLHGSLRTKKEIEEGKFGFDGDLKKQYIIEESDYEEYPKKHEAFTQLMRIALLQESFCLIGFSGDDPNFIKWAEWVRDILKTSGNGKVYFIDTSDKELKEDKKLLFKNYKITHVPLKDIFESGKTHKEYITLFLEKLKNNMDSNKKGENKSLVYKKAWRELKYGENLDEYEKILKYILYPNIEILENSKRLFTDLREKTKILEGILSVDIEIKNYSIRYLNLLLDSSYLALNLVFDKEELKKIKNVLDENIKSQYKLDLMFHLFKSLKYELNNKEYKYLEEKIKLTKLFKDNENYKNMLCYEKCFNYGINGEYKLLEKELNKWELIGNNENSLWLIKKSNIILNFSLNGIVKERSIDLVKKAKPFMNSLQEKLLINELLSFYEKGNYNHKSDYEKELKILKGQGGKEYYDLVKLLNP